MKKIKIISVVGARPNFMKIAPIHRAFRKYKNVNHIICHTGQHYDANMSKIFFDHLELPKPKFYLGVGSGSHTVQTAKVMLEFEKVVINEKPDLIIVVGDVNSTIACSLVASKLQIPVAHVEAGLRSFDRTMPEEINRILTDAISDYLFVSEESGLINLTNEHVDLNKIHFVGNTMIDSLVYYLPKILKSNITHKLKLDNEKFVVVTLHRPSNVDEKKNLTRIFSQLNKLSNLIKVIFPIHPRTKSNLIKYNVSYNSERIILTDPIGYIDFIKLVYDSELVLTDSGGIQEETTYLKKKCLTLRDNTERPITCKIGTNKLIGTNYEQIYNECKKLINTDTIKSQIPAYWDGKTAQRIAKIITKNIK